MPRADFYLIAKPRFLNEPLRLVCELARKANDANLSTLILARDAAQAEALDDLLWAFDDEAYIPHQIAGTDEEDELAPVLIAAPEFDAPSRPLVINLRDAPYLAPATAYWKSSRPTPPPANRCASAGSSTRPWAWN
ncbi:hypothetical protein XPN_2887 [Xanthomonas arboricola pv. pruni MAFF 301427]|nr:hypothetical protein XPN_2887 [Xanthomonas arboricola pv. pruni MAFF 301427]